MKLATFTHDGSTRVGIVTGDEIIDTQQLTGIPELMTDFLAVDLVNSDMIRNLANTTIRRIPLDRVVLEAPVLRPPKFLGIGLNYLDSVFG